jgi:hypothetical protein
MSAKIRNDAYVIDAEGKLGPAVTHMVVIEIADSKEEDGIRRQIVCTLFGEDNARMGAEDLNRWKAQVTIQ